MGRAVGRPVSAAVTTGEDTSFRAFFRTHQRRVVAMATTVTGDLAAAEEIAQEAFTRAFREWDRVRHYDDPGAWVRRVAWNLAVSRWRSLRREVSARLLLQGDAPAVVEPRLPDGSEAVWEEVRRLPRRQAAAIHLFYAEDRAVGEVAAILGCSVGSAKNLLHRARRTLAERLGEDWR